MSEETITRDKPGNCEEISGKVDITLTMPKLIPIEEMEICTPPAIDEDDNDDNDNGIDEKEKPEEQSDETMNPDLRTFQGLTSNSNSEVRNLFIFPDSCDSETNFVVLIQDLCTTIWWREDNETKKWSSAEYKIEDKPSMVKGSSIETDKFIWIVMAYDTTKELNLIHLRFDKLKKEIKVHLREFYSMTYISREMMHVCHCYIKIACLPKEKSALSLPGPSSTTRLFLYDLSTSRKSLLAELKKDSKINFLLPVDDWDNVFVTLYDHRIQLWNTTDNSIINSVLVDKNVFHSKCCFNVLHDKGLVHLFLRDKNSSAIDVIALNPKTGRYATLMNCNLYSEMNINNPAATATDILTTTRTTNEEPRITKIKRSGDQLLVVNDDGVIVYDLANSKSVLNCGQICIADTSIGFVNNVAVIFAATLNGKIINLLNT